MEQYIDKDALVAEIEKLHNTFMGYATNGVITMDDFLSKDSVLTGMKYFINTLEVKEVDLEKYYHEFLEKEWFGNSHVRTVSEMMAFTAKHFFELGLNTQHNSINIPNIDDILEEGGIDPFSKEAKIFKESYYMALGKFKAQKGE